MKSDKDVFLVSPASRSSFRKIYVEENGYVLNTLFSPRYGYNGLLEKIRREDFSRFKDSTYMDYTGTITNQFL